MENMGVKMKTRKKRVKAKTATIKPNRLTISLIAASLLFAMLLFVHMFISGESAAVGNSLEVAGVEVAMTVTHVDELATVTFEITRNDAAEGVHALQILSVFDEEIMKPVYATADYNNPELKTFMAFSETLDDILRDNMIFHIGLADTEEGTNATGVISTISFNVIDFEGELPIHFVDLAALVQEGGNRVTHYHSDYATFAELWGESEKSEAAFAEATANTMQNGDGEALTVISEGAENVNGSGNYAEGDIVHIFAGLRNGYTFTGWSASPEVSFLNENHRWTTFTMPAYAVTVTANWETAVINLGDVNGDGVTDEADVILLTRFLLASDRVAFIAANPEFLYNNADMDGNGIINTADLTLLRYLANEAPRIRVHTTFPEGEVNSGFVDIKYTALPSSDAVVDGVFYSVNGDFRDYIYWYGNCDIGQARVFLAPGINQLEFTVRDSLGRTATYAIENTPYFNPGVIAPVPKEEYKEPSVIYEGEYFVSNRLNLLTVWPNEHICHDEILGALAASNGEAVGYSHVTGSYIVQVPQNDEAGLEALGASIVAASPHLFESFGLLGGVIDDSDYYENTNSAVWPMPNPENIEYALHRSRRNTFYFVNNRLLFETSQNHSPNLYDEMVNAMDSIEGTIIGYSPVTGSFLVEFPTSNFDELMDVVDNLLREQWSFGRIGLIGVTRTPAGDFNWNQDIRGSLPFTIEPFDSNAHWENGRDYYYLNEAWRRGGDVNLCPFGGNSVILHYENTYNIVWPMPNPASIEYALNPFWGDYNVDKYNYFINNRLIISGGAFDRDYNKIPFDEFFLSVTENFASKGGVILGYFPSKTFGLFSCTFLVEFPTNDFAELWEIAESLRGRPIFLQPTPDGDFNWHHSVDSRRGSFDVYYRSAFYGTCMGYTDEMRAALNEAWRNGGDFYFCPFREYPGYGFEYGLTPTVNQLQPFSDIKPWGLEYVNFPCAWVFNEAKANHQRQNVRIGVIDDTVGGSHPRLRIPPRNIRNAPSQNYPEDYRHGTAVMGVIGMAHVSYDNRMGGINIARENLFAYDQNSGSVAEGLTWNVIRGVSVVNMSLGLSAPSERQRTAIQTEMQRLLSLGYDFIIVQSAGNERRYTHTSDAGRIAYNADRALRQRIITVGNLTPPGTASRIAYDPNIPRGDENAGSNFGTLVDVLAPGDGTETTLPGFNFETWNGTSMAAPHVTALAALIWDEHPGFTGVDVRQIIIDSARDNGYYIRDNRESLRTEAIALYNAQYYVINALAAMELAQERSYRASREGRLVGQVIEALPPGKVYFLRGVYVTLTPAYCFQSEACRHVARCQHAVTVRTTFDGFYRFNNITVLNEREIQNLPTARARSSANRYRLTISSAGFHDENIFNVHIPLPGVSTRLDDVRLVPVRGTSGGSTIGGTIEFRN
jgi:subtilisin